MPAWDDYRTYRTVGIGVEDLQNSHNLSGTDNTRVNTRVYKNRLLYRATHTALKYCETMLRYLRETCIVDIHPPSGESSGEQKCSKPNPNTTHSCVRIAFFYKISCRIYRSVGYRCGGLTEPTESVGYGMGGLHKPLHKTRYFHTGISIPWV